MQLTAKNGRKFILNSEAEDAEINAQIAADPEMEELDENFFKNARPMKETHPEFVATWQATRKNEALKIIPMGRPKKEVTKLRTTIFLDPQIISYFKHSGKTTKGWQTRMNAALNEYIKQH